MRDFSKVNALFLFPTRSTSRLDLPQTGDLAVAIDNGMSILFLQGV